MGAKLAGQQGTAHSSLLKPQLCNSDIFKGPEYLCFISSLLLHFLLQKCSSGNRFQSITRVGLVLILRETNWRYGGPESLVCYFWHLRSLFHSLPCIFLSSVPIFCPKNDFLPINELISMWCISMVSTRTYINYCRSRNHPGTWCYFRVLDSWLRDLHILRLLYTPFKPFLHLFKSMFILLNSISPLLV